MGKSSSFLRNVGRVIRMSVSFLPSLTIGLFLLTITINLAPLLQAKILGNIVNQIVSIIKSNLPLSAISFLVFYYAGVWGATRILNALHLYLSKLWRTESEHEIDLTIFKKRAEIDLGHYEKSEFQNLLQRAFSRGIYPLFELTESQFQTFGNLAVILASSIITSAISWQIYLITIVTAIPSFVVQFKYGFKVWNIHSIHSERQRKYYSMRSHLLGRRGITQTKILQNSNRIMDIIRKVLEDFKNENTAVDKKRFFMQTGASIILALGVGISLWLIVKNVAMGIISVGSMVFIISALGQLVGSLNQLLAQLATQLEKNLYVTDIFTVLDTKPFIRRAEHPIKLHLTTPPAVEFKNVSFKYDGREDWILKDVNLIINPGEKIALVGMNGAGKSTLVKLLSRIYDPNEGQILVNGVDLKNLDTDEWTSYLSVLLQDYLTYDMTVSESIAMSRTDKEVDKDLIKKAAEFSEAHEFIDEWKGKYDQQLGKEFEGGIEPSKGQEQKIALARTIYRNSLIMVLDEPTASIDALSETQIFEAMEKAVGKNSLIVITHRFNTTQNMDKIIVLEKGTVAETGTHKELIAHAGIYKKMFDSQAKAFR